MIGTLGLELDASHIVFSSDRLPEMICCHSLIVLVFTNVSRHLSGLAGSMYFGPTRLRWMSEVALFSVSIWVTSPPASSTQRWSWYANDDLWPLGGPPHDDMRWRGQTPLLIRYRSANTGILNPTCLASWSAAM